MAPVIGIITARGGSKGISDKNLRNLGGVPLVTWISKAAASARFLDQIILTTDSPAIARHALFGRLVWRPAELAADDTPDLPVFQHVLQEVSVPEDAILVHLRPTAPFVRIADIEAVVALAQQRTAIGGVRSVRPASEHPRKMYRLARSGACPDEYLETYDSDGAHNAPRQTLEPVWLAAGYVDAYRAVDVRARFLDYFPAKWDVPEDRAIDLDTERDWAAAEALILTRGWRPGG